ncbi:MAG TPA: ABC-F family ATP-binding cassette domain-containing protein [Mycobacteriales bacterium]|nr:ABC-F family ATP-binding cassette domain-containing protein [Mycobacteriales bacterium]
MPTRSAIAASFLKADRLSASYDGDPLFSDASLTLGPGERIGIVGPNGAGKTTLLKILAGLVPPAGGVVTHRASLGYLEQQVPDPTLTIDDYLGAGLGEIRAAEERMRILERKLETDPDPETLRDYGAAQERWLADAGWASDARIAEVRDRLDLSDIPADQRMGSLSGGEQTRVMLSRLLLERPEILLLDEPTNHLDSDGIAWLADYLTEYPGGVLVVSHDRAFLDRTVQRIVELDGIHDEPVWYEGGYSDYRAERQRRWQRLLRDYEAQEKARRRLVADIERTAEQARSTELSTHNDKLRRYAKKVARKAKARQRRLEREMRSARWIEHPRERPSFTLPLAATADPGQVAIDLSGVHLERSGRTVLANVDLTVRGGQRVVVTGPNGGGKTTLLQCLNGMLQPAAGESVVRARAGYLPQSHDALPAGATPLSYLRSRIALYEEEAEELLDAYRFDAETIRQPLARFSPGEVRRLLLACLVNSGADLLLLDEPTNFLDFDSCDVLESALQDYQGTIVAVTHDLYFAERLEPDIRLRVADGTVTE